MTLVSAILIQISLDFSAESAISVMNNSSLSTGHWGSSLHDVIGWSTAFGLANFAILFSNLLVLYAFYDNRNKMLKMRANYFLLNLCCADMMVGCVSLPLYLHTLVQWIYHKRQQWRITVSVFNGVDIFSGFASIFTLVVIAVERVYAIFYPLRHKLCRAKMYFLLLAAIWLLASFMTLLYFFDELKIVSFDLFFYTTATCLLLSFLITTAAYVAIWIRTALKNWHKGKSTKRDLKLAQTLKIITIVFALTWLPFQIINIIYWICNKTSKLNDCVPDLSIVYLCKLLQYANSFANPIVYSFRIPEFKKTLRCLLRGKRTTQKNDFIELCPSNGVTATRGSRLSRRSRSLSTRDSGQRLKQPNLVTRRLKT